MDENILALLGNVDNEFNENIFFYKAPEVSYLLSFSRKRGIPKAYSSVRDSHSVESNMIFFESALGRQYRGNPKAIYEYIINNYKDFKIIWCYEGNPKNIPGNPLLVHRGSEEYYKYLALSKYVINDTTFPIWFLRKETVFLQTWHGTPLKKLHWDREYKNGKARTDAVFYNKSKGWSALISPSSFATEKFVSAFKYTGEVLETGYPCNDIFFKYAQHETIKNNVFRTLNIKSGSKVVLYAPTWRDNAHTGNFKFDFNINMNVENFFKHMDDNIYLLMRMHHMSNVPKEYNEYSDRIIDVSGYDDIQELLIACNVLITDYSSVMFDFACSYKPMLHFAPDYDDYKEYRGMYTDLEKEAPCKLCREEEELFIACAELLKIDNCENNIKYKNFNHKYCSYENGTSSKKICEYLFG